MSATVASAVSSVRIPGSAGAGAGLPQDRSRPAGRATSGFYASGKELKLLPQNRMVMPKADHNTPSCHKEVAARFALPEALSNGHAYRLLQQLARTARVALVVTDIAPTADDVSLYIVFQRSIKV